MMAEIAGLPFAQYLAIVGEIKRMELVIAK